MAADETGPETIFNKQDERERRQTREGYRQFKDELSEQVQEIINPSSENDLLLEKLQRLDVLFKPVQNTREGALDSSSLVRLTELAKKKAQALKTDFLRFKSADFCDKVKLKLSSGVVKHESYGLSHAEWVTLGKDVGTLFRNTPVLNFMCGAFEKGEVILRKKRPVKEKEVESNSAKATKPTQLSSFQETDRGELTTVQVEHLLKNLWSCYEINSKEPICFFEFVTNPNSYGQTVENIFYTSFLVKDGHAKVFLDKDELPVIEPVKEESGESQRQSQATQKQQVVMTLTPAEWMDIVNTFEIEVPLIKPMKQTSVLKESNLTNCSNTQNSDDKKGKGKGKNR